MSLFRKNNKKIPNKNEDNFIILINTLIILLENLGVLDYNKIEKKIIENKNIFANDILNIVKLQSLENETDFFELKENYSNIITGYGPKKIEEFKLKLENFKEKNQSFNDFYNKAFLFTKLEITRYKDILKDLNIIIKRINNNFKLSNADKIVLVDYWFSFYKKEKLGFLVDIDSEISSMIYELKNLKYGGYGINEINKFKYLCFKKQDELKNKFNNPNFILEIIRDEIYNPFIKKYQENLKVLDQKINMLKNINEINEEEKSIKIEEFIIDFNESHGHLVDLSSQILKMRQGLQELKYGGFGKQAIDKFISFSQNLIIKEKNNNKTNKEILARIRLEYKKSINWYNMKIAKLETRLKNIKNKSIKEEMIKSFQEEMAKPIDINQKISKILKKLEQKNAYTKEEIMAFKNICIKLEQESIFTKDLEKIADRIDEEYEKLIIKNEQEHENNRKNLENKITILTQELANLQQIGYGESAVKEFNEACKKIINDNKTELEKKLLIEQKFNILKENYFNNLKIFTIWKNKQINKFPEEKEQIENQFNFLISLSPTELQKFYKEDSKRKKEAMNLHNNKVIINYLAKKEAIKLKNPNIINIRMKSFSNNIIPYNEEELLKAKHELENASLLAQELVPKEERLISTLEYINNTIFKQILNIRLNELQKQND